MRKLLASLCVVLTIALPNLAPHLARADDYKIGAILALSGQANVWGENARDGMELAASEVNARGGVLGKELRLVIEDSGTKATGAISAYQKLVYQNSLKVICGNVWGFLTLPLIPLADKDKVVLVSPTVMDRSVTVPSRYFFTLGHRFKGMHAALNEFFALNPSVKHAGTISFEDDWNEGMVEAFAAAAAEAGASIIKSIRVNDFNPDFRAEISALKQKGADGVLVNWRCEVARQRMREQHYEVPFLCSSDAVEAMRLRTKETSLFEGTFFVDWEASEEFRTSFLKRYGREPMFEAQNSYEAIRAIAKALESGGEDLRESMLGVSYQGVEGGQLDFSKAPFVNQTEAELFRIEKGKFIRVTR